MTEAEYDVSALDTVPEQIRSKVWAAAKPVALDEWGKGSADTTQMLVACSRALDAALAGVPDGWVKIRGHWVQVSDAPGYEVRGPLGKVLQATVLVALDQRAEEGAS